VSERQRIQHELQLEKQRSHQMMEEVQQAKTYEGQMKTQLQNSHDKLSNEITKEKKQHNQDEEEIRRIRKEMADTIDRVQEKHRMDKESLAVELEKAKSEIGSPQKLHDAKRGMKRYKAEIDRLKKKLREVSGQGEKIREIEQDKRLLENQIHQLKFEIENACHSDPVPRGGAMSKAMVQVNTLLENEHAKLLAKLARTEAELEETKAFYRKELKKCKKVCKKLKAQLAVATEV